MSSLLSPYFNILAVLFILTYPTSMAWRSFKIVLTHIDYETNSNFVDVKVKFQNNSEGSSIDLIINTLEVMEDVDLFLGVEIETEFLNYTSLFNKSLNFCKLLKERNSDVFVRPIYQDLARHGKFFKDCPIKKGTYTLHDYRVDEELFPSYLPEAGFKLNIRVTKPKNVILFQGSLYGRVDKSKGFTNLKMFSLG